MVKIYLVSNLFDQDGDGDFVVEKNFKGPFGDELIAGGFIQRFSLIYFFFYTPFLSIKLSKNFFQILIPILFL